MSTEEKQESWLDNDKEIPGQKYVCLSFISPEKVLADKNLWMFNKFVANYEVQYKIAATEKFIMSEVNKVATVASSIEDSLLSLMSKASSTAVDLSGVVSQIREARAAMSRDVAADLENWVKTNMREISETKIKESYDTYMFNKKKQLEDEFFAANQFKTSVRGLKVRGSYDTYNEANVRAKQLQKLDPAFNVFVGQMGFWLPWDPEAHEITEQEYAEEELNQLMKKYKENQNQKDEFYEKIKLEEMKGKEKHTPVIGEKGSEKALEKDQVNMFIGEDLAIARKMEAAKVIDL